MGQIRDCSVIGIVRADSGDRAHEQATALLAAGLPVVEVSLTTPDACEVIAQLAAAHPESVVGAGTVLDATEADAVIAAGARLIVTPAFEFEVIESAIRHDVAVVPGCLTPTEMVRAMQLGANAVKIFPAHLWTPAALAGLLQAMPDLPCVPTGGVDAGNAPDWIAAGATAVGVGASLTVAGDPVAAVDRLRSGIAAARTGRG